MMAVIFEVVPREGQRQAYLDAAAALRPLLEEVDGFLSIERFQSLTQHDKLLSLSFWRDEAAVARWRDLEAHRRTQEFGRAQYGMEDREQAPGDSRERHG
jgi:heme-degrading monooxygenase HmoA